MRHLHLPLYFKNRPAHCIDAPSSEGLSLQCLKLVCSQVPTTPCCLQDRETETRWTHSHGLM